MGAVKIRLFYFKKAHDHIHCLGSKVGRGLFLKSGMAAGQVQHPGLVAHNNAIRLCSPIQPQMEGVVSVCMGNGANHGQTAYPVEEVIAHHQGRTAAFLFMASLRVEVQIDDVSLLQYRYHSSPAAHGRFPANDSQI